MYEDVQNSNNVDKQMLNQLVNENVISSSHLRILKTPTVAILLGFFFISKFNEVYNEGSTKTGFSTKYDILYLKYILIRLVLINYFNYIKDTYVKLFKI